MAHCNTLQHTATHCNTLQHTATHFNTLQHTTRCPGWTDSSLRPLFFVRALAVRNTLQHTAAHSNTLQRTTTPHCNTLQHTTSHCNTLQHNALLRVLARAQSFARFVSRACSLVLTYPLPRCTVFCACRHSECQRAPPLSHSGVPLYNHKI